MSKRVFAIDRVETRHIFDQHQKFRYDRRYYYFDNQLYEKKVFKAIMFIVIEFKIMKVSMCCFRIDPSPKWQPKI